MLQIGRKDEEIVQQLKLGDTAAYDLLYDTYWKRLYVHVLNRIKDEEAAKDIIQNIFINIWERKETIVIKTSLEQFLMGAAKFQVLNYFRSEKIEGQVLDYTLRKFDEASVSIHELSDYLDLEKIIEVEVKQFPEKMRHAYLLKHAHHSTSEIAIKLNLAEQTVSNHICEAMRRIRKKLGCRHPEFISGPRPSKAIKHH